MIRRHHPSSASTMRPASNRLTVTSVILLVCSVSLLGGCASNSFEGLASAVPAPETTAAAPPQEKPPPFPMSGRWVLASPGTKGSCAMTFNTIGGPSAGIVAPSKGCPFEFYTTRKWSYEDSGLVLRDHKGDVLGQLGEGKNGRFEGTTPASQPITLVR